METENEAQEPISLDSELIAHIDEMFKDSDTRDSVKKILGRYEGDKSWDVFCDLREIHYLSGVDGIIGDLINVLGKHKKNVGEVLLSELAHFVIFGSNSRVVKRIVDKMGEEYVVSAFGKYDDYVVSGIVPSLVNNCQWDSGSVDAHEVFKKTVNLVDTNRLVNNVSKYKDDTAKTLLNKLANIYFESGNTEAVERVADLMGMDEIAYGIYGYRDDSPSFINGLTSLAREIEDPKTFIDVVKTIKKYDSRLARVMVNQFTICARAFNLRNSYNDLVGDPEFVRDFKIVNPAKRIQDLVNVMGMDYVVNLMKRYKDDADTWKIINSLFNIAVRTIDGGIIRKFVYSAGGLTDHDPVTAKMILENAENICDVFGSKYEGLLKYFEKRRDRSSLLEIKKLHDKTRIAEKIDKIKLSDFGNKQAERLVKLAGYLDCNYQLGLNPDVPEDLQSAYTNAENSLREYMKMLGIEELDKGIKFVPWIKTGDKTALKVLRGEKVKKNGIARTYELDNGCEINLGNLRKEIKSYANMVGLNVDVGEGDLFYLKTMAETIMSEVTKKKGLDKSVLGELKPNLSRILNLTYKGSRNYVLSVDPSDIESQMLALQYATSCLSPGGRYFEYTQQYLANPNTFWAVVKDGNNIVGRVTVFTGKDEKDRKRLARVSRVYSISPINEKSVDEALKKYAKEIGAEFMENGEMYVENLSKVYDDYVSGGKEGVVVSRFR